MTSQRRTAAIRQRPARGMAGRGWTGRQQAPVAGRHRRHDPRRSRAQRRYSKNALLRSPARRSPSLVLVSRWSLAVSGHFEWVLLLIGWFIAGQWSFLHAVGCHKFRRRLTSASFLMIRMVTFTIHSMHCLHCDLFQTVSMFKYYFSSKLK